MSYTVMQCPVCAREYHGSHSAVLNGFIDHIASGVHGQAYRDTVTQRNEEKNFMSKMPKDAAERKKFPVVSGVLDYFPDAILAVSACSYQGNQQHHPDKPLHWDKSKSTDEADALVRHLMQRGTFDTDGIRHSAKVAWRALALLQRELDSEQDS